MAQGKQKNDFMDGLDRLNDQQLRSILLEELNAEDVNPELMKRITDILAAREGETPIDAEAAFQQFLSQYAGSEPLYSEVEQELGGQAARGSEQEAGSTKLVPFRRLARLGILVAAILALFLAGAVGASAFGFRIGQADVSVTGDYITVSSDGGTVTSLPPDPCSQLREALFAEGVDWPVVPYYIPEGFSLKDFQALETTQGKVFICSYTDGENTLVFHYTLEPDDVDMFFPKDEGSEEVYESHGVEYLLSSNVGLYRAVWENHDIICVIHGVETKEELLKMIESIYSGAA